MIIDFLNIYRENKSSMEDKLKNLERRKMLQEYSYTKTELEYKKSLIEESSKEFLDAAYKMAGKERVISEEANIEENEKRNQKIKEDKIDPNEIDPFIREKTKKLYREISKRTHPDKDVEGLYTEIFMNASESYDEFRILDLYEYCERLGIPYEIEDKDIEILKTEIEQNRVQITSFEKTFVYLWSIQTDEKMKNLLLRQFVKSIIDKM